MSDIVIWNDTIEELCNGYKETKDRFVCTFCAKEYEKGRIYPKEGHLFDAYGAIKNHIKEVHGCTADYLLNRNPELVGVTEIQQKILCLMSEGYDDRAIGNTLGIAQSTVRNHRYKLREKQKQAKLYLALMVSLEEKLSRPINQSDQGVIQELHQTATMVDDRYAITDSEREKTIKTYIGENGSIKQFPSREKKKIIVLREIMKNFYPGREYEEKEINRILERMYDDYPTVRRALIEYGFLDRSSDCKKYWVKE